MRFIAQNDIPVRLPPDREWPFFVVNAFLHFGEGRKVLFAFRSLKELYPPSPNKKAIVWEWWRVLAFYDLLEIEKMNDEIIYAYTRAQAIEDGVLADVSEMAKEAGFRYPVALTHAVYVKYVEVPEGVIGQDESGRLWDILFMCANRARRSKGE